MIVHRGPDVDNVQLSITTGYTTTFTPCACFSYMYKSEDIADAVDLTTEMQ